MRLATIRTSSGTRAVRLDDDTAVETGHADVGALLAEPEWRRLAAAADGPAHPVDGLDYAPVVPGPEKIFCVGANYRDHIIEMGNPVPEFPTLFPKYARTLTGPFDTIPLPPESPKIDWEGELVVVVGSTVRRATPEQAAAAIAGYTVANDVTVRDYQRNTSQFLAGKVWERTTPLGPVLLVAEPGDPEPALDISTTVIGPDGADVVQASNTAQLLFTPVFLVQYVSTLITLVPGDLILTGTPGGVGHARTPPRYLRAGETLETAIDRIGVLRNPLVDDRP